MNCTNYLNILRDSALAAVLVASLSTRADVTLPNSSPTSQRGLRVVSATI